MVTTAAAILAAILVVSGYRKFARPAELAELFSRAGWLLRRHSRAMPRFIGALEWILAAGLLVPDFRTVSAWGFVIFVEGATCVALWSLVYERAFNCRCFGKGDAAGATPASAGEQDTTKPALFALRNSLLVGLAASVTQLSNVFSVLAAALPFVLTGFALVVSIIRERRLLARGGDLGREFRVNPKLVALSWYQPSTAPAGLSSGLLPSELGTWHHRHIHAAEPPQPSRVL